MGREKLKERGEAVGRENLKDGANPSEYYKEQDTLSRLPRNNYRIFTNENTNKIIQSSRNTENSKTLNTGLCGNHYRILSKEKTCKKKS